MEYKHTTQSFVELIRKRTEESYEENEPVKLSPVMLLAYIEEFEEMVKELDYLRWFHRSADFGPAESEVVMAMQAEYARSKPVPATWLYE